MPGATPWTWKSRGWSQPSISGASSCIPDAYVRMDTVRVLVQCGARAEDLGAVRVVAVPTLSLVPSAFKPVCRRLGHATSGLFDGSPTLLRQMAQLLLRLMGGPSRSARP